MAATDIGARNVAPTHADDLDDLFDYDVGDVFRDVDTNMDIPTSGKTIARTEGKENGAGLGIDEEIKVTKKRAPVAKLDEDRLLSSAGIPKLRRITKERLKFKGKGHEYSDLARLLNMYQLWLDDLYPRAKFIDGLAIIEKLGHTKRLQTMRKEWINEGKPRDPGDEWRTSGQKPNGQYSSPASGLDKPHIIRPSEGPKTPAATNAVDADDDEIYDATPKKVRETLTANCNQNSEENLFLSEEEEVNYQPPDDELDALLAEDDMKESASTAVTAKQEVQGYTGREANFDDEMEAMAGMDDMW